jgi:hypothetical protein
MRARKLLVLCALVAVAAAACGSDDNNDASSPEVRSTTTTTNPLDRAAVDALVDRIAGPYKPVLHAESGDVPGRQLAQSAKDLEAIAIELKDPAKRPRGVPPAVIDNLVGALGGIVGPTTEMSRSVSSCTGASNPRCADLYLRANQAQTTLNNAILALADLGTRPRDVVQNLLFN